MSWVWMLECSGINFLRCPTSHQICQMSQRKPFHLIWPREWIYSGLVAFIRLVVWSYSAGKYCMWGTNPPQLSGLQTFTPSYSLTSKLQRFMTACWTLDTFRVWFQWSMMISESFQLQYMQFKYLISKSSLYLNSLRL